MNPNYVYYAKAQGRTTEAQMAYDADRFPGGCMAGFLAWVAKEIRDYKAVNPRAFVGGRLHDHDGFREYLEQTIQEGGE